MLISEKRKFIFIHVYKNAGRSIRTALEPFAQDKWQYLLNKQLKKINISTRFDSQPFDVHIKANEMMEIMGRESFKDYFSFAIVRNPWDWQVSLYTFMLKEPSHYQHELVKKLGSFDEYIRWRCDKEVRFQKDFIYSKEGELLIDFVGRYENLEAEFEKICAHIGVKTSLPKLNVSKVKPYVQFYTDDTIELVGQTFKSDIELFGYEFTK